MNPAILLSPWLWLAIASAAAAFCANGWRSAHDALVSFEAAQTAVAEYQSKQRVEQIKADNARKDANNDMLKLRIAGLAADNKRLRDSAGASSLPARPADTRCPEAWACFDRGELDDAIRRFTQDTAGLIAEGAEVRLRLTTAIEWAK